MVRKTTAPAGASGRVSGSPSGAPATPKAQPPASTPAPPKTYGKVAFIPSFNPDLDASRVEYRKRLSKILEQVATDIQSKDYDQKTVDENMGSFTLLPSYDKEGWIGGHDLKDVREGLERRKEVLMGNKDYNIAKDRYDKLPAETARLKREIDEKKRQLDKARPKLKAEDIEATEKEIAKTENTLANYMAEQSKLLEQMRNNAGLISKVKADLDAQPSPDSPIAYELMGKFKALTTELKLINEGLTIILDNLSLDLSKTPQDSTFVEKGKVMNTPVVSQLLGIASTQKARDIVGPNYIGKEIKRKNVALAQLSGAVERMRGDLAERRGKISTEAEESLHRILRTFLDISGRLSPEDQEKFNRLKPEVYILMNYIALDSEEKRAMEDIFGPELGIANEGGRMVLRGDEVGGRLPRDVDLSPDHILMRSGRPLADLRNALRIHGQNKAVYEAWEKTWLTGNKIDSYREKNGTKDLWKTKEQEKQQIETSKELLALNLRLLELEDYTPPRTTDNTSQEIYHYATILSGEQNPQANDIKSAIDTYSHESGLQMIERLKQRIADALLVKEKRDKEQQAKTEAKKTDERAALEELTAMGAWEKELLDVRQAVFEKKAKEVEGTLDSFTTSIEDKLKNTVSLPEIEALLLAIDAKKQELKTISFMGEIVTKWKRFGALFRKINDGAVFGGVQAEVYKTFLNEEPTIARLVLELHDKGGAVLNNTESQVVELKNKLIEEEAGLAGLVLPVQILKKIAAAGEPITEAVLVARGVGDNDAKNIIRKLTLTGILKP